MSNNHELWSVAYSSKKIKDAIDSVEDLRVRLYIAAIPPTEGEDYFNVVEKQRLASALTELSVHASFLEAEIEELRARQLKNRLKKLFKK